MNTNFLGSSIVRNRVLSDKICRSYRLTDALNTIEKRWPTANTGHSDSEKPIFVFSAGWGSGSTLVQRLIVSSGTVMTWGEPFDIAVPIQRLAQSLLAFGPDWPPEEHFLFERDAKHLSEEWIANLVPPFHNFQAAHREFLLRWLKTDTDTSAFTHWGLKEVRLTIDHARYLKWLFPNAKFVFVYRDLYRSYLSCRRKPWLSEWPGFKATPIVPFAHHWAYLLDGFINGYQDVGGYLLKYEDLISDGYSLLPLQEYLNLDYIDNTLLNRKVGGRSANRHPLILPERIILNSIGGQLRKSLGYD